MALIPTTWDPSTKEVTAYLSGGDLVYSTDNYYANIVTSVATAVAGRWYWETTLDVFVPGAGGQFGAITRDVYGGLGRDWQLGSPVQGDVLGFALDIGAGTIEFFKNGASVRLATGLEANPGETWKAYLQLTSPPGSGETVSATTNFGASAFVHPAPTGFNAGFGTVEADEPPAPALEVAGIAAEGAGAPFIEGAVVPLDFIPAQWSALTLGPNSTLSGDGLVYSVTADEVDPVSTASGTATGKWYWEVTLDAIRGSVGIGVVDPDDTEDNGLNYLQSGNSVVSGDTLGVGLNIPENRINLYRAGAVMSARALSPAGEGVENWYRPALRMSGGTVGSPAGATVNFGASAFMHPAPEGFSPGFGSLRPPPLTVTGIASQGAGTPVCTVEVKTVGIEADGAGTPGIFQRVLVPGIQSQGAGKTTLATDRKVQVYGAQSAGAGIPQLAIVAPGPASPRLRVAGIEAAGAGGPGSSGRFSAAVAGLSSQGPGTPIATSWHAVQGIELVGLGAVSATAKYLVAPGAGAQGCGSVSSRIAVYPAGIEAPGVGSARFVGISRHFIAGLLATGAGTPSASTTFRVSPVPAPPGAGMPALRPTPC